MRHSDFKDTFEILRFSNQTNFKPGDDFRRHSIANYGSTKRDDVQAVKTLPLFHSERARI